MIEGLATHPEDTELARRARALLASGPADAVTLVGQVCGMGLVPAIVADHLAATLFAGRREFARDAEGRWCLTSEPAAEQAELDLGLPPLPPRAAAPGEPPGTPLHEVEYVVVDVETTGSRYWKDDRITEVAAIVVRGGQVVEEFETLVNPERSIPPIVSRLTNITWGMVQQAPRFADICDRLVPVLEGRVFVGHNAEFDWRFVTHEIARATGRRLTGERVCTVRLARRILPQLRSRRLDALADWYGIGIHGRHRAGGDARATAQLLLRLFGELQDRDCHTFEAMRDLMLRRTGRRKRARRSAMPRGVQRDGAA